MTRRPARHAPLLPCLVLLAAPACVVPGRWSAGRHALALSDAPASVHALANPYRGDPAARAAGGKLVARLCAHCHEERRGRVPSLASASVRRAPAGDLFWFVTNGSLAAGMPAWARLPAPQRWQIVTFLQGDDRPAPPTVPPTGGS